MPESETFDDLPEPRPPLTDDEIDEARRIIANQASTMPKDGNIGPAGAWARAEKVSTVGGRLVHDSIDGPTGWPSLAAKR